MNSKCYYFVEGICEVQLIRALRESPQRVIPGKIIVFNAVQNLIPKSRLLEIQPGSTVVFVFDTDIPVTEHLKRNIELVKKYCGRVKFVFLAQVLCFEDELVRSTDVRSVSELTKSKGISSFKADFCRLKTAECRRLLERHHLSVQILWTQNLPEEFRFLPQNSGLIKLL